MNSGRQQGAPALVRIGFVRRAVGLKGEVEVEPLTDQQITERLAAYGHHIARRTVAKYRDQLGILPSSLRG